MQITLKTLQQQTFKIVVSSDELVRPSRKFIPCENYSTKLNVICPSLTLLLSRRGSVPGSVPYSG